MSRNCHYCACSVFNKCIIRRPERKFFAVKRIYTVSSKRNTCFYSFCRKSFYLRHFSCICPVFFNSLFIFICCKFFNIFIFRSNYKISYTINSIRSCCINRYFKPRNFFYFKADNSTLGFSYPVCLHGFNIITPAL